MCSFFCSWKSTPQWPIMHILAGRWAVANMTNTSSLSQLQNTTAPHAFDRRLLKRDPLAVPGARQPRCLSTQDCLPTDPASLQPPAPHLLTLRYSLCIVTSSHLAVFLSCFSTPQFRLLQLQMEEVQQGGTFSSCLRLLFLPTSPLFSTR